MKNNIVFWLIPFLALFFWQFKDIIFPILIGIFLGLSIQTISNYLTFKIKTNFYINIFLTYLFLILLLSFTVYLSLKILIEEIPSLWIKLSPYFEKLGIKQTVFKNSFKDIFFVVGTNYLPNLLLIFSGITKGLISVVLIFVVSMYTSFKRNFLEEILDFVSEEKREYYRKIIYRIKRKVSFWFFGQIILMLSIGISTFIILKILKIPYAPLLALISGVFEIIPILGPTISLTIASMITFLEKPEMLLWVIGSFLLIQQIENHFLVPIIMRKATSVDPIIVIFGVLVGGKIGGILGIIVILPILAVFVEILNYIQGKK